MPAQRISTLGVLGGMGPIASAEFVRTVYGFARVRREQEMPRVLLDSDPGFPDRTEAILSGRTEAVVRLLGARLRRLVEAGSTHTVVACVTAHHLLARVEPAWRHGLVSLTDRIIAGLSASPGRFLMLCSRGTRVARVFPDTPGWAAVADRVVMPGEPDQEEVHRMIYRMKVRGADPSVTAAIDLMRARYGCSGVVLGCTEFHLVSHDLVRAYGEDGVVDPLRSIAVHVSGPVGDAVAQEAL